MNQTVFGPKGSDLLYVGKDNRISLWDAELNKRRKTFIEKKHLAHNYVSCAWKHGKKDDLGTLAVGCSDGTVLIWDLVRGVVANVIGSSDKGQGEVSDVVFSQDGKSIFTCCASESTINEYKVPDGSFVKSIKGHKKGTSRLAGNPKSNALAVGGSSLKMLEVSSGNKRKLEGHFTGSLQSMCFTQCGRYLTCCASDSQEVLVYDVHADASSAPIKVFSCDENVTKIVSKSDKSQNCVWILCLLDGGGCALYTLDLESKEVGCSQVSSAKEVVDGVFLPSKASSGSSSGNKESECQVCFALKAPGAAEMVFQSASFDDGTGVLKSQVELGEDGEGTGDAKEVSSSSSSEMLDTNGPSVLGPMETGPQKRLISEATEGDDDQQGPGAEKRSRKGSDGGDGDMTMEQRLKKLTAEMSVLENSGEAGGMGGGSGGVGGNLGEAPTSDSLVTLLDQALQSGDDSLLEQCIGCEDLAIIEATAQRLPTGRVVSFMKRLVSKFEKRPSRGILLTRWLAAILRSHTAFLIAVPDLSSQLASLSAMLEQRLSTYTKLTALGGRLDLLLSQVSSEAGNGTALADGAVPHRTVVVPEEEDD